jgi:diamine N-acetyltransferase
MAAYRPSAGEGGASWRDTTARDVPDILRLVRALAEYERLADECVATEADFHAALFGPTPEAAALLAGANGTPIAVCIYRRSFSTFTGKPGLWIEDIFVEPAHRKRGLARAAFALVARRALADGCTALGWNVLDWNAPAVAAYRAMGAEPQTGWTNMRVSGQPSPPSPERLERTWPSNSISWWWAAGPAATSPPSAPRS